MGDAYWVPHIYLTSHLNSSLQLPSPQSLGMTTATVILGPQMFALLLFGYVISKKRRATQRKNFRAMFLR